MAEDFKCPFCGSTKLHLKTPYTKKNKKWPIGYEAETTYCCLKQAKNQEYREKRFHPRLSRKPDSAEVARW